jgi:2-polyprenyl-3-methyl-5-hydroxy-6-metoxy-1,4-benzoquinol methylase
MGILTQKVFHLICVKDYHKAEDYDEDYFQRGFDEAKEFFDRFDGKVDIKQKTVLDVGCGFGSTCIYTALNGARKVVGIDIDEHRIDFARSKFANDYQNLSNIVEFRLAYDIGHEKFDIVLSKDSFEHYADPENFVFTMKQNLKKEGIMVIGFGPLWKSPYGGHIRFMTKVPWAHLFFPESVIMAERKRFRPDEDAELFEQVDGGLNKMTLTRYLNIIRESGLEFEYFKTNVSRRRLMGLFSVLRRIPFCREFFTLNVYSIMRMRTGPLFVPVRPFGVKRG